MRKSINTQINMTEGSIAKKSLLFALPVLLSGWLQLLYNAADLIVCGNFGSKNAVGAISSTTSLIYLIVSLFLGFSVGANVLIAHAVGSKNREKANRIIGATYAIGLASSIVLLLVGVTCSKLFLQAMGTPKDIIDLSSTYMFIYFLGMPFVVIYNFGAALLRGLGDTSKPFVYLLIAGLINVGLNFLFVITFKLDVAGVAIATITSQGISAILVTITLLRGKNSFAQLNIKQIRFYKQESLGIIKMGVPAGIQSALFSLSNVVIQSSINSFGSSAVTGTGAESSIESFMSTGVDAFAQATVAFVAANYGSRNVRRIRQSIFYTSLYGVLFSLILGLFTFFFGEILLKIYISEPEAIAYGMEKLKIVSLTYVSYALVCTISSAIRGLGYSFAPMFVSLIGICVLRIVYIYTLFPLEQFHTIAGLYISYPLSWLITALAHTITYLSIKKKIYKQIEEENAALTNETSNN